jgi:hypothetical protein
MGMRQPSHVSPKPAYGLPEDLVANEPQGGGAGGMLLLFVLVIGLAVATMWYVVLPALSKPARVERSCEVVVLKSGSTACVTQPGRKSRAAAHPSSGRAKH